MTKGTNFLFSKNKIDKYIGEATLINKNEIQINGKGKTEKIFAEKIIIATGSEPSNLKNIKIDEQKIVTSTGALDLKSVPKKVIVIGAGVIGLELGTVWRRLGSEVEVIEFLPRVLNGMDSEVSDKFHKILLQQGLKFKLEHSVEKTSLIKDKVNQKLIPVISPLGLGKNNQSYNINGDNAAGAIAKSLKSRRLLLMTNVEGVLNKNSKLINEISSLEITNMIKDGTITEGMIPKINTCLDAINNGVTAVAIIDGRKKHSVLFEIFSDKGSGTLIRK